MNGNWKQPENQEDSNHMDNARQELMREAFGMSTPKEPPINEPAQKVLKEVYGVAPPANNPQPKGSYYFTRGFPLAGDFVIVLTPHLELFFGVIIELDRDGIFLANACRLHPRVERREEDKKLLCLGRTDEKAIVISTVTRVPSYNYNIKRPHILLIAQCTFQGAADILALAADRECEQ